MRALERCSSDDMYSTYLMGDPECSTLTAGPIFYPILTNSLTYTYDSTNNPTHWVYPYSVKPDMHYFPQKLYSDDYGKWGMNCHKHKKWWLTMPLLLSISFASAVQNLHKIHMVTTIWSFSLHYRMLILHLELLVLQSEMKAFIVRTKWIVVSMSWIPNLLRLTIDVIFLYFIIVSWLGWGRILRVHLLLHVFDKKNQNKSNRTAHRQAFFWLFANIISN